MSPEDIEAKTKAFVKTFKSMDSETGGIAAVDNTADFHQLTSEIKARITTR